MGTWLAAAVLGFHAWLKEEGEPGTRLIGEKNSFQPGKTVFSTEIEAQNFHVKVFRQSIHCSAYFAQSLDFSGGKRRYGARGTEDAVATAQFNHKVGNYQVGVWERLWSESSISPQFVAFSIQQNC